MPTVMMLVAVRFSMCLWLLTVIKDITRKIEAAPATKVKFVLKMSEKYFGDAMLIDPCASYDEEAVFRYMVGFWTGEHAVLVFL